MKAEVHLFSAHHGSGKKRPFTHKQSIVVVFTLLRDGCIDYLCLKNSSREGACGRLVHHGGTISFSSSLDY